MEGKLKLCSLNTRGLRDSKKRMGLFHWLKTHKNGEYSFVLLQETHSDASQENKWKQEWGSDIYFSHGVTNARGVAILCPKKTEHTILKVDRDAEGRIIILEVQIDDDILALCNIYAPTQEQGYKQDRQLAFLNILRDKLVNYKESIVPLVIGGDLNTYLTPSLDKQQKQHENIPKTSFATELIGDCNEYNLLDCWRILNPNFKRFTWRQPNPVRQSRIDYWLISSSLINMVSDCDIQPSYKSDHSLITLEFRIGPATERGPGMWKFNVSLLKDVEYVAKINTSISDFKDTYDNLEDKSLKWELIKCELRRETIYYCKCRARKRRELVTSLSSAVVSLEKQLADHPSQETMQEYQVTKQELESIITHGSQGAALRARADRMEYNEKNSRYFADLERKNYTKKMVKSLIVDNKQISDQKDILKAQGDFYKKLYSSTGVNYDAQELFLDQPVPQLDAPTKDLCDEELTYLALGEALKGLPNGKTPGSDGFNADFYKFFWGQIKELVFDSLQYSLENGELSIEQRRSIITLIPKKDKDTRLLKNWRPISLLNTDYKILTKLLALRMQKALPNIINQDQVGYLKGRYIGQNIRTIIDTIEYTRLVQTPGMVVFLDFEKAFDSIEWDFLQKALSTFGFGTKFIDWINIIYSNINSCVINNGHTTEYFSLERGIRQGCPLSAYLFIVAVELLASTIRNNEQIQGIPVFDTCIKIIQMADDTTVFLQDTKSLKLLFNLLHSFSLASGLRLNKSKTEAMWMGSEETNTTQPCGIRWVTEAYSLGVWFCTNQGDYIGRNYSEKFDKFSRALNMWKQRDLSLKGKITVVRTMALPILLYITSSLPIPEELVHKVNREVYKFIWDSKPEKISRVVLTAEIERGGLKMINFEHMFKAQKVMWAKRLVSNDEANWKAFPLGCLAPLGKDFFKCSFDPDDLPVDLPLFYHQMLNAWGECKQLGDIGDKNAWDIRREALFFNKNMLINGQYIYRNFSQWYRNGIFLIHDIIDERGHFLSASTIEAMYNFKVDVLMYNSLKDSVPVEWRRLVRKSVVTKEAISGQEEPYIAIKIIIKPLSLLTNNDIYALLLNQINTPPKCIARWITRFPDYNFCWEEIFRLSFETVRCTRLQTLQYKIVHRIFPCNYWVAKWETETSEHCVRCQHVDYLEHYFYHCNVVNTFWKAFVTWWLNNMEDTVELSDIDILFKYMGRTKWEKALNYCILYGKLFIVKANFVKHEPSLYTFLIQIRLALLSEKAICQKNGQLDIFKNNFGKLYEAIG